MISAQRSPTASVFFLAALTLLGATHCGGEAKSDVNAAAGYSQAGGESLAGGTGTNDNSAGSGGSSSQDLLGGPL